MDKDGYYRFNVNRGNYTNDEVHACEVIYTYSHVVFADHLKDTIVAFKADDVISIRRIAYE